MSGLEQAFYAVSVVSLLGTGAIARWAVRRISRANAADTEVATKKALDAALASTLQPLDARLGRIERQFGQNGGGLREAVNNVGADVRVVKEALGGLSGRFEDHLVQSREDRSRLAEVERVAFQQRADYQQRRRD